MKSSNGSESDAALDGSLPKLNGSGPNHVASCPSTSPDSKILEEPSYRTLASQVRSFTPKNSAIQKCSIQTSLFLFFFPPFVGLWHNSYILMGVILCSPCLNEVNGSATADSLLK